MSMLRSTIAVAAAGLVAGSAIAQTAPASGSAGRGCFRGGPLPACSSFWITEAGYALQATGQTGQYESGDGGKYLVSLDFGGMKNVSPRIAVGGTIAAGTIGGVYLAAKPRIRYWFSNDWSGDLAPGIVLRGVQGEPRFTADASVMYQDRIGITAQAFVLQRSVYDQSFNTFTLKNRLALYAGLRLGSKLGLVGAALDMATLIVAFGLYAAACGGGCD